jgi:Uma2 family endonuclease
MRVQTSDKRYTVEEYIHHELKSQIRSEFIDGQLYEMAGEKDINNEIALRIAFLLMQFLKDKGLTIYAHDVKVKIFGENKYYYPDVFITGELRTKDNQYIKSEPVLIVEVVSETSQVNDYVDKYIDYTKIPSLQYYIIIEPETTLITSYKRGENGEWITTKYTRPEDVVKLDFLGVSFQLKQVYS